MSIDYTAHSLDVLMKREEYFRRLGKFEEMRSVQLLTHALEEQLHAEMERTRTRSIRIGRTSYHRNLSLRPDRQFAQLPPAILARLPAAYAAADTEWEQIDEDINAWEAYEAAMGSQDLAHVPDMALAVW